MSGAAGTFVFPTTLPSAELSTGPDGLRGMAEPDSGINGRQTIAGRHFWVPVLPLTGGAMSGGIHFGATQVGSGTDLSRHLALWGTSYGIAATTNIGGGSPGASYSSGDQIDFYTASGWSLRLRTSEIHWSEDGWRFSYNRSNGDFYYLDWAGNAQFGINPGWPMFVVWGHLQATDHISAGDIRYHNITGVGFAVLWDGGAYMSSYMYIAPGNWTLQSYSFACDEMWKQDIEPAAFDCLGTVRKVRLYQFRWRGTGRDGRPGVARADAPLVPVGFIAQRLRDDFPEALQRPPDPRRRTRPQGRGLEPLGTDVNTVLATLTGAIQQLDATITAKLEARRAAAAAH